MIRHLCELCRNLFHRKRSSRSWMRRSAGTSKLMTDLERAVWHAPEEALARLAGISGASNSQGECSRH